MSAVMARPNPGGWYDIPGVGSWHGSDDPRYLRAIILTGTEDDRRRAGAVLAYVERDTSWLVRAWRDLLWSR